MRTTKDSGFEWIGIIPTEWGLSKIGQVYRLRNTKVNDTDYPPLSVTNKGIVPQLDTAAKTSAHDDRKLVKKGDFAINSRSDRRNFRLRWFRITYQYYLGTTERNESGVL